MTAGEGHPGEGERPPAAPMTEEWALALWCEELPRMRRDALNGGWTRKLDKQVADLAAGGSAITAWAALGVPFEDARIEHRAGGALVAFPGQDPVDLTGDYGCPHNRCPRRAERNSRGEPPVCGLDGAPMRFAARP